jgi:hypothetical protein
MSSPNSSALHATHSRRGGCGGPHGGGLGSSVGMCHSPCLGQYSPCILHVASGATTQQGRGGGAVSPMAYYTPAHSLTFSLFVATSQGHSMFSLSQLESTLAAKRKCDTRADKDNDAKRWGKSDTEDDAEYNNEEDFLPLTDAPMGEQQREQRRLAALDTATAIEVHCLEFMQRAFPPKPADEGKKKTQGAANASITVCRLQSKLDYIMYVLMHWQVGVKLHEMNPGTERDRLTRFCRQHYN